MDSVAQGIYQFSAAIMNETSKFDQTTWGVLAITTLILGYFLLRGNSVR